jgi:geranylgeranyl diphosphate synthase type II
MASELARAAGAAGMVAGQMADMALEGAEPAAEAVEFIHRHKTAALIAASMRLGALAAGAAPATTARLGRCGERLGLAFQIADDALDLAASSETLGKTAGKDAARGKITYPAVFGLGESRRRARELAAEAVAELEPFGAEADLLREMARYVVERRA